MTHSWYTFMTLRVMMPTDALTQIDHLRFPGSSTMLSAYWLLQRDRYPYAGIKTAQILFCFVLKYQVSFNSKFSINLLQRLWLKRIHHYLKSWVIRFWLTVRQTSVHALVVRGFIHTNFKHNYMKVLFIMAPNIALLYCTIHKILWFSTPYFFLRHPL